MHRGEGRVKAEWRWRYNVMEQSVGVEAEVRRRGRCIRSGDAGRRRWRWRYMEVEVEARRRWRAWSVEAHETRQLHNVMQRQPTRRSVSACKRTRRHERDDEHHADLGLIARPCATRAPHPTSPVPLLCLPVQTVDRSRPLVPPIARAIFGQKGAEQS